LYSSQQFHNNYDTAMDDYRVGTSRGDGGLGIWNGKKLYVSKNYFHWRLITSGPIRSVFELHYAPWNVGNGRTVSEVKRISIDAGSWMSKEESTFASNKKSPLTIGIGIAERSCGPDGKENIVQNKKEGWMTYMQPEDKPKGRIGVAILLRKGSVETFTNDAPNLPDSVIHAFVPQPIIEGAPPIRSLLAITKAQIGKRLTYYFGACWDRSGDFTSDLQWENYVRRFAECRDEPLKVSLVKQQTYYKK
jgi:unsaturated rhamnogalacturonyl hydrolase